MTDSPRSRLLPTSEIIEQVPAVIDWRPSYRTITPDPEIWREAGAEHRDY